MGYIHVEVDVIQTPKKVGGACGDAWDVIRTPEATTVFVADGIGSGLKANIYAKMTLSRITSLIDRGFSLRRAFSSVVQTMHESRGKDLPYAVFSVIRILKNGEATVLAYEMPEAIYVGRHNASIIKRRNLTIGKDVVSESNLFLEPGEGILMFSDGISQAGTGMEFRFGWESEGVSRFVNECIKEQFSHKKLCKAVHDQARNYWQGTRGDDCTVVSAFCRKGNVVNIFTGPPLDKSEDSLIAGRFLARDGMKIVCGASTAGVVARKLERELEIELAKNSMIAPPGYKIEGIDLVTEGAITLNQVYNIFDTDPTRFEPDSPVSLLCDALLFADKVSFIVGRTQNQGHGGIAFTQRGILPRQTIVKLLAEKLREAGKLVQIELV